MPNWLFALLAKAISCITLIGVNKIAATAHQMMIEMPVIGSRYSYDSCSMIFTRSFITFRRLLLTITAAARYLRRCCEFVWMAFKYLRRLFSIHSQMWSPCHFAVRFNWQIPYQQGPERIPPPPPSPKGPAPIHLHALHLANCRQVESFQWM